MQFNAVLNVPGDVQREGPEGSSTDPIVRLGCHPPEHTIGAPNTAGERSDGAKGSVDAVRKEPAT